MDGSAQRCGGGHGAGTLALPSAHGDACANTVPSHLLLVAGVGAILASVLPSVATASGEGGLHPRHADKFTAVATVGGGPGTWEPDSPLAWRPTPAVPAPAPALALPTSMHLTWTGECQEGPVLAAPLPNTEVQTAGANWAKTAGATWSQYGGHWQRMPSLPPQPAAARWQAAPGLPQPYHGLNYAQPSTPWGPSGAWGLGGGVSQGGGGPGSLTFHAEFSHPNVGASFSLLAPSQAGNPWPH